MTDNDLAAEVTVEHLTQLLEEHDTGGPAEIVAVVLRGLVDCLGNPARKPYNVLTTSSWLRLAADVAEHRVDADG